MIYLTLFYTFFKIGLFTIGGGYAMIPMIMEQVSAYGWMEYELLIDFIAISESTPGVFSVNVATFVGNSVGGMLGAVCATVGLVMPSLIIIQLIALAFSNLMNKPIIKKFFYGLRPCVVGLIANALYSICVSVFFVESSARLMIDYKAVIIFIVLLVLYSIKYPSLKKPTIISNPDGTTSVAKRKKIKMHPLILMCLGAILGIILYSF